MKYLGYIAYICVMNEEIQKIHERIKGIEDGSVSHFNQIYGRIGNLERDVMFLIESIGDMQEDNAPIPERKLTTIQSEVLKFYLEGMKGKDIAWRVGCKPGNVSVILGKLRKWRLCV